VNRAASPADGHRILTLDVIRGIAVMGIFSVNVVGMAMIEAAYFNPPVYGFDGLADRLMWLANFILVDHKLRSLFSILFGASMLLVIDRAAAAGQSPVRVHLARMLSLLVLGLAHFYFIWWGDILTLYAAVGIVALIFTPLPPRLLLLIACLLYAWDIAPRLLLVPTWYACADVPVAQMRDATRCARLRGTHSFFEPTPAAIAADRRVHASYRAFVTDNLTARRGEPWQQVRKFWAETLALMLIGMAGFRSGFLTGAWSRRSYRTAAALGIGIGGTAFAILAAISWASGFRFTEVMLAFGLYSEPFGPIMALGYAALTILAIRPDGWLTKRLAAIGRAAFTNYIGASLIGLAVFVWLGWYGRVSRFEAWLLVPVTWAVMLAWSKPWLDRFRFGPFEWLWRTLARGKLQPMRKSPSPAVRER
jgi:uncharacterized protein